MTTPSMTTQSSPSSTTLLRPLAPWQVIARTPLIERAYLRVVQDHVRLDDGREIDDFCLVESPDWAAVLCITSDRRIALVRQYRHGLGAVSWELPAGALEPDEDPLDGARRELLEETGYASDAWQPLLTASVDPARVVARAHFYAALDCRLVATPSLDATEELQTVLLTRDELLALVDRGELQHGIHLAAVLLAVRKGLL
jgi:8-oxo-dGTP pyrophosphatase MutT (NUDIX family)